ncbi:EamA-like transporter family [Snodgrassella alvi SCGC AB-598-P14]|nr:EamA-like transporter family [Snodgrassella alvi SCGC AB-598-P14]
MLVSKKAQGHLIALFTIFIWGTTYISTKVLLAEFKPIEILFFRFMLGYFTLWILAPHFLSWQGIRKS